MNGFNFEKDLLHQKQAVESTIAVFENLKLTFPLYAEKNYINPTFEWETDVLYKVNIENIQYKNGIKEPFKKSKILDIMMETGTGKTYTYTKTIFELNKNYGIFKFIIVVPTLSIKAGTVNFLKSDSCREHFKEQYRKTLHLHIVESQKNNKNKKLSIPLAVSSFVNAGSFEKNSIHVMIINAGMINSETMQKSYDKGFFDKYFTPFDAIASTKTFMIIDEPHKFGQENKTWQNIQKMQPQLILRYGATFTQYENLIYKLTAVDAFNSNLVKGVIGYVTEFDSGKNAIVKFIHSDGKEAHFELIENNRRKTVVVSKKESFKKVHPEMTDLTIENLNKNTVLLSNGLEMKKGDKINPYSYAQKLEELMIQRAIKHHFEIERELLTREVKIKPLTLFFIDNIDEYRSEEGYIRKTVEQYIKAEIEELLKTENDIFYKTYLEKSLKSLSATHGGYFSKDNAEKDEVIEKEINEILHDKQALLDLENPRRFIFSKWTLREGWDNPNVFQICKLRSSGSEISKLQEVGRGLRLPVNEYGNRVKDEQFHLHYFVDFTESDFVDKLVNEINQKSGAIFIEQVPEKISEEMIKQIIEKYDIKDENILLQKLIIEHKVIDFSRKFLPGGFDYIKQNYPAIFEGVDSNKVRKATDPKKKITIRTSKYHELKELWEKLNEKVILEYKFDNEASFKTLFTEFLKAEKDKFTSDEINESIKKVEFQNNQAVANEIESVDNRKIATISTEKYSDFLKELSKNLNINIKTLHQSIIDAKIDINNYLNPITIRDIKKKFNIFLMTQVFNKYSIEYKKVSNSIHPTKLTDEKGNVLTEIAASDVGNFLLDEKVAPSYFFEEFFYDSDLEKENIKANIQEVIVFTKIPKNSIKIPIAGGFSYSPDFAYVLKCKNDEIKLNFIVETKNLDGEYNLREKEKLNIKHAERFFNNTIKIQFRTQFKNDEIIDIIKDITQKECNY